LSRTDLKGTAVIDTVLSELQAEGLIEYQRVGGVPHTELSKLVQDADIVVDQLLLGTYGAFAAEAMAAGRVTVGHVAKHVRDLLPSQLPIVEATTETLRDVIEHLVSDRASARVAAAAGYEYAKAVHDGRRSAEALASFLGTSDSGTTA
jgi:glycosyltransferase involved in cell wall biosynthesis